MSDSTSLFTTLVVGAANLPTRIMEMLDSLSPASLGGRKAETTANLTWGYFGGKILIDGVATAIASGTKTLTASAVNYLTMTRTGVINIGTTLPAGERLLYTITAGVSTVSSYVDNRTDKSLERLTYGIGTQAMADANQTISQALAMCDSLVTTGALTVARNLVVPLVRRQWTVRNNCTGFGVQVIGASGTGITIGIGKTAIVECDGTNVNRITADV